MNRSNQAFGRYGKLMMDAQDALAKVKVEDRAMCIRTTNNGLNTIQVIVTDAAILSPMDNPISRSIERAKSIRAAVLDISHVDERIYNDRYARFARKDDAIEAIIEAIIEAMTADIFMNPVTGQADRLRAWADETVAAELAATAALPNA